MILVRVFGGPQPHAPLLSLLIPCVVFTAILAAAAAGAEPTEAVQKVPVVFDTDIADDIDDTWALCLLLKCPELDVRLITTAINDTQKKAALVAKLLEVAGRTDIPLGIGIKQNESSRPQYAWAKGYELASFPGKIRQDGVQALIETIMGSAEPITLIAVGPVTNVAAALDREPRLAAKCHYVAMAGCLRRGARDRSEPRAEYNVVKDTRASQKVLSANWRSTTIAPLDVTLDMILEGQEYQRLQKSGNRLAQALLENYRAWEKDGKLKVEKTKVLHDVLAIYLALRQPQHLRLERMSVRVTDDGFTVVDPAHGTSMDVAIEWKDLRGFQRFLVDRLTE